jgi:5-methyltetrahydrofolate--homocysteine methyltransferase
VSDFLQELQKEVMIGSGAMSTNLSLRGYNPSGNDALWAIEHEDEFRDLLRSWVNIGCKFIYLGIGSANWFRLRDFGLQDRMREINTRLAQIARDTIPPSCYFAYTLSAAGLVLPPMGDARPEDVYESYAEQVVITEKEGVDVFEAQGPDIQQTSLAMKAVKDNSSLPSVGMVHSFFVTPKGFRTMIGVDPVKGAKNLEELGADVIGTICGGLDYQEMTAVLKEIGVACSKPLVTKPNAGTPHMEGDAVMHPRMPEQMAAEAPHWVEAGARIISGCCGTTLEHMAKVIEALKK